MILAEFSKKTKERLLRELHEQLSFVLKNNVSANETTGVKVPISFSFDSATGVVKSFSIEKMAIADAGRTVKEDFKKVTDLKLIASVVPLHGEGMLGAFFSELAVTGEVTFPLKIGKTVLIKNRAKFFQLVTEANTYVAKKDPAMKIFSTGKDKPVALFQKK